MRAAQRLIDPFDDMSDDDFDAHVETLFSTRPRTVGVSLRIPPDLLERVKREAARTGIPYQTFIKAMLDAGVSRLEGRAASTARRTTRTSPGRPKPGAVRSA